VTEAECEGEPEGLEGHVWTECEGFTGYPYISSALLKRIMKSGLL
jgi:hypothetical protein